MYRQDDPARAERYRLLQEEVLEIAEVLARQQKRPIADVWDEALSLHRVRYEPEPELE